MQHMERQSSFEENMLYAGTARQHLKRTCQYIKTFGLLCVTYF